MNIKSYDEACMVLEGSVMDLDTLNNYYKMRENILIQDEIKLQKNLKAAETEVCKARIAQNDEKELRIVYERKVEPLKSETSNIESERNSLIAQNDQYMKHAQEPSAQVKELITKCNEMECDLTKMRRDLENKKEKLRFVTEENSQNLTSW